MRRLLRFASSATLCIAALLVPWRALSADTAPAAWRVVIVPSGDPAQPAIWQQDQHFRRALLAAAPQGVTFFTEPMDTGRFNYAELAPQHLALMEKKYAAQPVDLVVGIGERVIDFIRDHGAALWPGAQVLIYSIDAPTIERFKLPPGAQVLMWQVDVDGTLDLIQALQPGSRRLIVVGGDAESDRELSARVAERVRARQRWAVETWNSFSVDELRVKLAAQDASTAVLFTSMYRDAAGRASFPADALSGFAAASRAPVYGLYGSFIGRGATAGSVVDFDASGQRAAELAIAMLSGQPLPAPGTQPLAATRCVADYPRLATYGLSTAALPEGCEVRGAPRTLWTEYRDIVLLALAVLIAQTVTIAALLVQRRRRRLAEADAASRRLELGRAMRFAAMGELTASIAHEINQPLGAILGNADAADLLLKKGTASTDELRAILADIRREDLRAHEVIRRLRALLEKHEVEHGVTHLHPALDEVLALLSPEARRRGVTLERAFDAADDRLLGDAVQLQQVLLNLALNAMDAMAGTEPAARRTLRVATADRADVDAIELVVADRGSGLAPDALEAVFESFYTTKPQGMGLGLAIVRAIVEAHEGRVIAAPRDGGGAVFTVTLPRRIKEAVQ
jgi:signal transduction histidine kinase/ABC-type uncharacterized transport system substrate-binding protein